MITYKSVYREVMKGYERARDDALSLLEKRKEEVYCNIPEIAVMDKQLAKLGISLAKLALAGDIDGMKNARAEAAHLNENRRILLSSSVGENYLTAVYRCNICEDTGFVQNVRCKCLKQRLVDEYYSLSNMKEALREENFDTYDLRLFSEEIIASEGLSQHANMQTVYRLATQFVSNFDTEFSNLLLHGAPGLGKTFVCHSIAKDLLDTGRTVLYQTVPRLCKVLEDYRFNRESMTDPDEMLAAIDEVDLLVLDDLGAEMSTIVTSAAIFDVINQRLLSRKHTVISTNLSPDQLISQYSERIISRFFGNYQLIKFFGEDIRMKKKYGGVRIS